VPRIGKWMTDILSFWGKNENALLKVGRGDGGAPMMTVVGCCRTEREKVFLLLLFKVL
jgi:hypothetical protein